jgi:hypothetical protein
VVRNRVFLREYCLRASSNGKKPGFFGLWVARNTGGQKPGFFARILRQGPQQRQKPGFLGLRVVRNLVFGENTASGPVATAKNPVSLVWFLWF